MPERDLLLLVFNKKQQMSRDPVPITAESSTGDRHPVGTGLRYAPSKDEPMF